MVLPAQAGMIPNAKISCDLFFGSTRASGDDPSI